MLPENMMTKAWNKVTFSWLILRESVRSFQENNNFQTAATLAYYGFFSLIPLLLLVLIILSRLSLSSEVVFGGIEGLTAQVLPQFNDVILKEISALAGQKAWGLFSIVVLVWVITPFASAIRTAFRRVFKGEKKAHFLKSKLFNLAAVLALLTLFILLVMGKIFYSILTESADGGAGTGAHPALNLALGGAASIIFIVFFYLVFCPVKVTWGQRLTGAAITTILLFIIRPAFALLLRFNPNYGYAFGSLKAVFLLTVWIYYSFLVILFGAEIVANMQRREAILLRGLFTLPPERRRKRDRLLERFVDRHRKGDVLFRDGDQGGEMFYITEGEINVEKNGRVVKVLKTGDYFGEMSMLLDDDRTATCAVASPEVELVAISRKNFDMIIRENPAIVREILVTMARRLKQTTSLLERSSSRKSETRNPKSETNSKS